MAYIKKRETSKGIFSWTVNIRKKGIDISKTFYTEEDAKTYEYYKEKLIQNMENFEVGVHETITIDQIFELKIKEIENDPSKHPRYLEDFQTTSKRLVEYFGENTFYSKTTYEQWKNAAIAIYQIAVYRGGKTESCKRIMSPYTLRRIFATASSAVSCAISQGINLENHPLAVLKTYINSFIKEQDAA